MMAYGSLYGKLSALAQNELDDCHAAMIRISRALFQRMIDHAKQVWPTECCGLLAGKDGVVTRIYPLENREGSRVSYQADPEQQFRAFQEIEDLGLDLLAIYHSHPDTESYPSKVDREKAFYSEVLHIIISLKDGADQVRAFRIPRGRKIIEERLEIF